MGCAIDIVRMKKLYPVIAFDFFSREASVIEQASIAVIDRSVRSSAPKHFWNGLGHLAQVEFALLGRRREFERSKSESLSHPLGHMLLLLGIRATPVAAHPQRGHAREVEMGRKLGFDQLLDLGLIAGLQVLVGAYRGKHVFGHALDQRIGRFLRQCRLRG